MAKKRVNITLDPDIHSEAKELGLNISGVSERALRQYV
ncbi:type II toxin-antitoxin system CcdA family antitoxin [Haloquadratum walsbyi]